jgi:hypothetical protein
MTAGWVAGWTFAPTLSLMEIIDMEKHFRLSDLTITNGILGHLVRQGEWEMEIN